MAEKNKYGQYFTIDVIADFMVSLIEHAKDCSVIEPSCGKGIFIDNLFKHKFFNISAYEIDETLNNKYEFVQYKSFLSIPVSEKYDVVIGNPPYIRWKNIEPELKKELENNELWKQYFNSLCDYLFIFILKSIEHLNENGELIFICTDYWMNTTHSLSLRNYMCENGYFEEIYHFKEAPLFEKVTASFVIFKYRKGHPHNSPIKLFKYTKSKGTPTINELLSKSCFNEIEIPSFKKNCRWILAPQNVQDSLSILEKACVRKNTLLNDEIYTIGDFCDIGNGMVSGLDAAFQIKDIDNLNTNEIDALITVLKAKDLERYRNISTTKYIFIKEQISKEAFMDKYPHFVKHFEPYLEKLEKRYSYNRIIPYWEFVFPRNQKLFEREEARIFIPCKERISTKSYFRFCYAPSKTYPTQDVTAILRKSNCKESIEYILAYLNNVRVFNWLINKGIVKGEIVEFSEAPIASIPYKPIDWSNPKEVQCHNEITNSVKLYQQDGDNDHITVIDNLFNTIFHE